MQIKNINVVKAKSEARGEGVASTIITKHPCNISIRSRIQNVESRNGNLEC